MKTKIAFEMTSEPYPSYQDAEDALTGMLSFPSVISAYIDLKEMRIVSLHPVAEEVTLEYIDNFPLKPGQRYVVIPDTD